MPDGTPDSPWQLKTPSGQSEYRPGATRRSTRPRWWCRSARPSCATTCACIDDLQAMLTAHGDWMPLGSADEQKPAAEGTVEAWARAETTRSAAGTG